MHCTVHNRCIGVHRCITGYGSWVVRMEREVFEFSSRWSSDDGGIWDRDLDED